MSAIKTMKNIPGKSSLSNMVGQYAISRVPVQRDVLGRTPILAAGIVMKTRTHFTFRIDKLDVNGEVFEHVAGLEDFELAVATYEAACKRWPGDPIMLRQGARVVKDSRKTRLA